MTVLEKLAESRQATKKPVTIDYFYMTPERFDNNGEWPVWMHDAWQKPSNQAGALYPDNFTATAADQKRFFVHTLEGSLAIVPHDVLIRGVKGEIYPCKRDVFMRTYDVV